MAIALECINFIVPFSVIRKKYPGGLVQCLLDYRGFVGSGPIWFDEHLFRDGAMNDLDIMLILSRWERYGVQPVVKRRGKKVWKDCCIPSLGGSSTPCDWIEYSDQKGIVWLKGTEPGETMYCQNCTKEYMFQMIEKEEERLRSIEEQKAHDRREGVLHVPDFLLFTDRDPGPGSVGVVLEFMDRPGNSRRRYMNEQLLQQMEHGVYSNNLHFMSFRGRLMRVVDIALAYGEPQAVIRLRGVTAEDQRPNKWRGVEPEWIPWLG